MEKKRVAPTTTSKRSNNEAQFARTRANKIKRIEKQLKEHPNTAVRERSRSIESPARNYPRSLSRRCPTPRQSLIRS